jgi:hypothetical protein
LVQRADPGIQENRHGVPLSIDVSGNVYAVVRKVIDVSGMSVKNKKKNISDSDFQGVGKVYLSDSVTAVWPFYGLAEYCPGWGYS